MSHSTKAGVAQAIRSAPSAAIADLQSQVEDYLEALVFSREARTQRLVEAMRYSLLAGGKRIRPVLALATAEALGRPPVSVLPLAAAVEMIHRHSLVHDDLPALDDGDLCRGRPTAHVAFGEAVALLAGDALLAEAMTLALCRQEGQPALVLATAAELTQAAGVTRADRRSIHRRDRRRSASRAARTLATASVRMPARSGSTRRERSPGNRTRTPARRSRRCTRDTATLGQIADYILIRDFLRPVASADGGAARPDAARVSTARCSPAPAGAVGRDDPQDAGGRSAGCRRTTPCRCTSGCGRGIPGHDAPVLRSWRGIDEPVRPRLRSASRVRAV